MKHGLIDRRDFEDWLIENCTRNMAQLVKGYIKEQPTVDAVPVVRCGECEHRKPPTDYCEKLCKAYVPDDFYCKYGERKEKCDEQIH